MKRSTFIKNSFFAGMGVTFFDALKAMPPIKENTGYLKMTFNKSWPQFDFFAIDSLGKNKLVENVVLNELPSTNSIYSTSTDANKTLYRLGSQQKTPLASWVVSTYPTSFSIASNYCGEDATPFIFNISQYANHATLLGIMGNEADLISLPAVLHFPDMGTLRITCDIPGQKLNCTAKRFIDHPYVRILFPAAIKTSPKVIYHFEVTSIFPPIKGIENDARYDCFRRNFISIFQLNPFLKILANNSASDACAFTLFKYSEVALYTPPLAVGLSALDLVRMTLDRYLSGQKGYGILGYDYDKTWDIPESATSCNSLDSYPSLLIAACNYAMGNNDKKWFVANYAKIKLWADKMLAMDADNDGLLEFCLSGNSGSWKGDKTQRPANWWDTIGFGHKDAYSNALAYHALILLEKATLRFGSTGEQAFYGAKAKRLKDIYTTTFYNPQTGVLAGWKSADGQLHDYYFTFVNGVAISYGLVDNVLANAIMDKLLLKMKEVGFTDFGLGLPGNLIPVKRADYTDLILEVGGGKREDNSDGFQIYENGGATACYTYFTIHALQKLKRKKDVDLILLPLLKSMSEGNFQGRCPNGRTKDWKTWKGECWGYEGFLVDNYMFLLAVLNEQTSMFQKDKN